MDADILTPVPETETVTVKSHSRVRVIGQPASNVTGYSYENIQWPTSQANNAAAGEAVLFSWDGSDGNWTGRVTGALSALGVFLAANSTKTVVFRSERAPSTVHSKKVSNGYSEARLRRRRQRHLRRNSQHQLLPENGVVTRICRRGKQQNCERQCVQSSPVSR